MPSFMDEALREAGAAGAAGEVPVGCVIVRQNAVIARALNRTLAERDPTAPAEPPAIRPPGAAAAGPGPPHGPRSLRPPRPRRHVSPRHVVRPHPPALLRRRRPQGWRGGERGSLLRLPDLPSPAGSLWRNERSRGLGAAQGI